MSFNFLSIVLVCIQIYLLVRMYLLIEEDEKRSKE